MTVLATVYDQRIGTGHSVEEDERRTLTVHTTYAGDPTGNLTPDHVGQFCHDTSNNALYWANGTANTDWVFLGKLSITAAEAASLDGLLATAAELNRAADVSTRIVNLTAATLSLTEAAHDGKVVTVNKADGSTLTLPAATGSGARFTVFVGTTITSNNLIIQVADATDTMKGTAWMAQDGGDTAVAFEAGANDDTITLNGSTKGGIKGDRIELIDVAADLWSVQAFLQGTGTEATPFSAAVS